MSAKEKRKYHSSSSSGDDEPEAPPQRGKVPDPKLPKKKKDLQREQRSLRGQLEQQRYRDEVQKEAGGGGEDGEGGDAQEEACEDEKSEAAPQAKAKSPKAKPEAAKKPRKEAAPVRTAKHVDEEEEDDVVAEDQDNGMMGDEGDREEATRTPKTALEHKGEYTTLATDHLGIPLRRKGGQQKEQKDKGREYTVSIAIPGSIIDSSKGFELKTYVVGQIARACVIFNVDEIVVYKDMSETKTGGSNIQGVPGAATDKGEASGEAREEGKGKPAVDVDMFVGHVLQYLDCPPYLRKPLFPMHRDLRFAGVTPPLAAPHHVRLHTRSEYREGLTVAGTEAQHQKGGKGNLVDCGLYSEVQVDKFLPPGLRVTVKLDPSQQGDRKLRRVQGKVVSPTEPRTHGVGYWGYSVRLASSLSEVLSGGPHKGGYDITIGTSAHAAPLETQKPIKPFKHMLVVFGGPNGLDACVEGDEKLNVDDASLLFDRMVNTCPNQGSSSIRTEEALFISLSALRPAISAAGIKSFA